MTVTADEFYAWLGDHGVDYRYVRHVEFVPEGVARSPVHMKVTRYAVNAEGRRFIDQSSRSDGTYDAAQEVVWVQLRSLPTDPVVLRAAMPA